MLKSKSEYEFWLIQYAQELVRDESRLGLNELGSRFNA